MTSVTHLTNQSQFVQSNAVFNGTNITGTIASNGISLSVANPGAGGGIANAAGTQTATSGTVVFSNSNGITFGMSNSSIITAQHNGLTTAMASNRGSDFVQATAVFNGTNASGTIASNAISISVAAPLSPATNVNDVGSAGSTGTSPLYAPADHVHAGVVRLYAGSNTGNTAGNTDGKHGNWVVAGTNNITISGSTGGAGIHTVWVSGPNVSQFLTTARASNDAVGLNTAVSNVTATINSSGFSFDARGYAGTNTGATNASLTVNSNGVSVSVGNYLTSQSNQAFSASGGSSAFQTLNFANSNGITFSNSNGSVIASHNGLTTARASTDAIGLNTAQSNVTWTVNSSGLSFDARGYAGTGTTFGGTNISVSMTQNSNGLQMSASVAAPGAGGGVAPANSQTTYTSGTAQFVEFGALTIASTTGQKFNFSVPQTSSFVAVGNATLSTNGSTISISVQSIAAAPVNFSAGTTSNNIGSIVFSNANGVSFGLNGSTMTASHNGLTTAMASDRGSDFVQATAVFNGTNASGTIASNGISVSVGNYITTARASTDAIGLNTAQSNVTWTVNSGGLSFDARGYAGTGTTASAQNINASFTLNSNGLNYNISVPLATLSKYMFPAHGFTALGALSNGMFSINRMDAPAYISATRLDLPVSASWGSSATANTWGYAMTIFAGIYTKNGSTLSSVSSGSVSTSFSAASNTAGQTQVLGNAYRAVSVPMNINMSPGEYFVGYGISTNSSSVGTATTTPGLTMSILGAANVAGAIGGVADFTAATNTSTHWFGGVGVYTAAISTVPPTVSLSAINQTGASFARANIGLIFRNI